MSRMRLGHKPGIGPVLKIMRNDADNPWTTPNTDYGKFMFNSEAQSLSYILDIRKFDYGGPSVYPPGPGAGGPLPQLGAAYWVNPHHLVISRASLFGAKETWEFHYFDAKGYYGLDYDPIVEVRFYSDGTGSDRTGMIEDQVRFQAGTDHNPPIWFYTYDNGSMPSRTLGLPQTVETNNLGTITTPPFLFYTNDLLAGEEYDVTRRGALVSVWSMPAKNEPLELPARSPTSGQLTLQIKSTAPQRAAMARPGFDMSASDPRAYIFDSNRVPGKILGYGEITIAANGTSDHIIPAAFRPLSDMVYVEMHVKRVDDPLIGSNFFHPTLPVIATWGNPEAFRPLVGYQVMTDRVRFFSKRDYAVTVRYIICASDDAEPSSDTGTPVLRSTVDDHFQICRPGAGDPPKLNDILVDSRLPYLPIIKEGFIPASAFTISNGENAVQSVRGTHRAAAVTFPNDGSFKPFVKFTCVGNDGQVDNAKALRWWHTTDGGAADGYHGKYSGRSIIAEIENDKVTFHGNPTRPAVTRWQYDSNQDPHFFIGPVVPTGVRYYVLAIPN